MQEYKRHQGKYFPSLTWYVDKIAQKRWTPTVGYDVPHSFPLRYKTELGYSNGKKNSIEDIKKLLPEDDSFVDKASHFSGARSVRIVECCKRKSDGSQIGRMNGGHGYQTLEDVFYLHKRDYRSQIARHLMTDLEHQDMTTEDAQLRLEQGMLVEERFLSGEEKEDDKIPALEFKCFVIWSRLFACHYRRGALIAGYYNREGALIHKKPDGADIASLPVYVDWSRVVEIAERRAAHMDQLRVDIYVGRGSYDRKGRDRPIRYVLSEVEMEQTSSFDHDLKEEGTRLWIAGYKIGNNQIVPNTEVPRVYVENGLRLPSNYTEVCTNDRDAHLCI